MNTIEITLPQVTIQGHYIEDAKAIVSYKRLRAERDVGFFGGIEICGLESRKGRPLCRILKHMPQAQWDLLNEYVSEADYFDGGW
jgi:hypothetical protein